MTMRRGGFEELLKMGHKKRRVKKYTKRSAYGRALVRRTRRRKAAKRSRY